MARAMQGEKMKGGGRKAKNAMQTFKRLMDYLFERYKKRFILGCILIVFSAAISIAGSVFIGFFTQHLSGIMENAVAAAKTAAESEGLVWTEEMAKAVTGSLDVGFFGLLAGLIAVYVFGIICNFT